jgi:hypothetical protein
MKLRPESRLKAAKMLPPWDSLPDLQAYQDRLSWILVWCGGLAGAVAAAIAVFMGTFQIRISNRIGELENEKRRQEQEASDEAAGERELEWAAQIAAAERKAETAAQDALDASKRAGDLEPRRLSQQQVMILEGLKDAPDPHSIEVTSAMSDREATDFAVDFEQAFQRAGWEVTRTEVIAIWTGEGPPPRGLAIEFNTEGPSEAVKSLMASLHRAGLEFVPLRSRKSLKPLLLRVMAKGEFVPPLDWPAGPVITLDIPPSE